jgi:large subunit ribosomal protein L15
MKLHDLQPNPGEKKKKHRVGRGLAGKGGKTAGRGTKGQKARDTIPAGFEGGQLPLMQRIPKLKGFTNPFRVEYTPVNLDALDNLGVAEVTPEVLVANGLVGKNEFVKILGRGSVSKAITVKAHAWSASAEAAITGAGGTVEKVALPFAVRPAAKGNAHTNR